MNAGTESRFSGNYCRNVGKNAKMNWKDDSLSGYHCISIDGGVLKHNIQVYIFLDIGLGAKRKIWTADESALVLSKLILQLSLCPVHLFLD